jgi:hypothetical protein
MRRLEAEDPRSGTSKMSDTAKEKNHRESGAEPPDAVQHCVGAGVADRPGKKDGTAHRGQAGREAQRSRVPGPSARAH